MFNISKHFFIQKIDVKVTLCHHIKVQLLTKCCILFMKCAVETAINNCFMAVNNWQSLTTNCQTN